MNLSDEVIKELQYYGRNNDLITTGEAIELLITNAVKSGISEDQLYTFLQEINWSTDHIEQVKKSFLDRKSTITSQLLSLTCHLPHLIDISWKSHYILKDTTGSRTGTIIYLITFILRNTNGIIQNMTFSCSVAQLNQLLSKLRQASQSIQKYSES